MNELIQQARDFCEAANTEKENGNVVDSAALSWAITQNFVPQLCDALEAAEKEISYERILKGNYKSRAEKAEAERDACKVDMRLHNDNLCETCKVENCGMRSNPPLSRTTICFKHERRGVKGE